MRRRARPLVPGRPAGPTAAVLITLLAAATAYALARQTGLSTGLTATLVALGSGLAVALVAALRARRSFRLLEGAYIDLDRALFDADRINDRLSIANGELAAANVELRAAQIAVGELLNLANARSNGQMRCLVEETGDGLADILLEQLRSSQRVRD